MNLDLKKRIDNIVSTYEKIVKGVDEKAHENTDRAYGGIVRSEKGKLQEYITEEIIKTAWESLGGDINRLNIDSKKHQIRIKQEYVNNLDDPEVRDYINSNIEEYIYELSVDKQVYVDYEFVIGIECKAYTENAMLKRILVDFSLLKTKFPNISCYLFQLESQLGGDYSKLNDTTYGSKPTHTLMSYFPDVRLKIVTFLKGERKVDKPIHKEGHFKSLDKDQMKKAILLLRKDFSKYL